MSAIPTSSDRSFSCAVRVNGESSASMLDCIQSVTAEEDLGHGAANSWKAMARSIG